MVVNSFESSYKDLRPAQRKAVDTIEGPVLVIAGPGTGKTQLLGMRVANILKKTDTDPSAILCLTFTNKAATNMRGRLMELVGPASRDVNVKTFHSFAAEIMNNYPDYFWSGARLATAPDAVQLEIIQKILSDLPLDNPLAMKFAGAYTAIKDVQEALKLTKEAGLTPEKLAAIIDHNIAFINTIEPELVSLLTPTLSAKTLTKLQDALHNLPDQEVDALVAPLISLTTVLKESFEQAFSLDEATNKTVECGKWKKRWLQTVDDKKGMFDERKRNDWWRAVVGVYKTYRDMLHARGYYDYADMLVEVISQLEQQPDLLANVQERYLYVLIDEFQDTNAAQLRLAHLVADHHTSNGSPNLMAVGDDDQSIFKFNGAELNNMLSFKRIYPKTHRFVLEDSFRSSQAVLDTSKKIIEQASDRLVNRDKEILKNLVAIKPPREKGQVAHYSYPTHEHQLSGVAKDIRIAHTQNDKGSIAVLARSHASLQQIAAILLSLDVPVQYEQQSNIFDHEAVKQVCALAEILVAIQSGDQETANARLTQVLRHPMWKLSPGSLWKLAISNFAEPAWLDKMQEHEEESVRVIAHHLLWLAGEAQHIPLALVIEYLLGLREGQYMTSPVREYFAAKRAVNHDYLHALSAIRLLRTLVDEFSYGTSATLEDFVQFVKLNRDNNKIVADESPFVSEAGAVQLLTVHKAKGLEFDYVYVIDAIEDNWRPKSGGRKPPANLPLKPYGDDFDDYARLLYVAATRARHTLIINSYYMDHAGKELLASPLVRGALETTVIDPERAASPIEVLEQTLRWPRLDAKDEKALLGGTLENYALSVTNLLNFLDVPKGGPEYFFERNILRLPDAKTSSLAHGTAMHAALEVAQKLINTDQFDISLIFNQYEAALREEHLPWTEFNRYLVHGQGVIKQLFEKYRYELPKDSYAEQRISDIKIGDASIGGKLDRIDAQDKSKLVIVDYKTGKPLSSFTTKDQNKAIKAWKHRTQLIFYALLTRNSARYRSYEAIEGRMLYVEAGSLKDLERSYYPSPEEIKRLAKLVEIIWAHIRNLNFPSIAHYPSTYEGIATFEDDLIKGEI